MDHSGRSATGATVCLLLTFFLVALSGLPAHGKTPPALPAWFTLLPEVEQEWESVATPGDANRLILRRGDTSGRSTARQRVFVIFSKRSSAYNTAMAKILSVFQDKQVAAEFILVHYGNDPELSEQVSKEAQEGGYDLVFSMGSDSTELVHKTLPGRTVPVVSVCSKDPVLMGQIADYEHGSGTNIAYTSLNVPMGVQMTYLRSIKPDLRNIAVLYARQNTSAVITQVEPLRKMAESLDIRVLDVAVEDGHTAREELSSKIPEAVAEIRKTDPEGAHSVFWITGSTEVFREIATINKHSWIIPVLSVVPDIVREGRESAVLSIGVGFESNAHIAALYGVRILNGEVTPGELSVGIVSPPDIAINFGVAKRIGMKIPFSFFESASFVYDHDGRLVLRNGLKVAQQ